MKTTKIERIVNAAARDIEEGNWKGAEGWLAVASWVILGEESAAAVGANVVDASRWPVYDQDEEEES